MIATPLSTSLRRLRIFMAALFAAVVAVGSAGLFAPAASAAAPTVTVSLQRTFTGTGQGTSDQCVVNAAHGFTPGDETAADDYVCSQDKVGYRMDLSVKTDANPSSIELVFKIGPGMDSPSLDGTIDGPDAFCVSRPGQWTAVGRVHTVQVGGRYYPACTIQPDPNVNLAYRQDFTVTAAVNSPNTIADAQILQTSPSGSQTPLSTADGYTVLRALRLDLRVRSLSSYPRPVKVNGQYYVAVDQDVRGETVAPAGTSGTKGSGVLMGQSVKMELSGAPAGTLLADSANNVTDTVQFSQGGFAGPGTQNLNPSGSPVVDGATARVLIPIPASGQPVDVDFTVRVAQDSPVIKLTTGEANMGGGAQIGQQLADCAQSTDTLGGLPALGSLANNDCARVRLLYNVPGDLISKRVGKDGGGSGMSAPPLRLGNASGQTKTYTPGFTEGQTATSGLALSSLPGSYPIDVCDVWDQNDQSLQTGVPIRVSELLGSPPAPVDLSLFTVYYSHQAGSAFSCGDPSTLDGWSTDPAQVQGGVNAIRIKSNAPIDAVNGLYFAIPFTPNLNRTDLDEYGATPQLWDRGYITTGRTSGWGTGASAFSYAAKYSANAAVINATYGNVSPGQTSAYAFYAQADISGTLTQATPRVAFTLPPCASLSSTPNFGSDWTVDVQPGSAAGGAGCEDDVPTKVTATATRPFTAAELSTPIFMGLPIRMSPLAVNTSQMATAHMDFVDPGLFYTAADTSGALTLVRQAAVLAAKTVDKASMQRDEQLTWTMGLSNTLSIPVTGAQWIDVLPYNGDANGTSTAGRVVLDSSTVPSGATAEYSKTAPASVSNNPADASNQAGGGTVWCDSYTAGGDCPSSLSEVTAVRYTMDLASGASQYLQLKAHVDGGKNGDTVSNRLGVGTSPDLAQPVPSPDKVTTALFDSSLAGTVWWDEDKDGARGASEPGIPGVKVEAVSDSGDVLSTTTTDAAGHYGFPGLLAGTYRTRVVADQDVLKDAEQTYSYKDATGGNASLTSTPFALGRNATLGDVDFGFFRPAAPTPSPSDSPTATPSPTDSPTASPSPSDSPTATPSPTDSPTATPTPTDSPTGSPTGAPTGSPTKAPTTGPTGSPSAPATSPAPGKSPSGSPSSSAAPSAGPTSGPSGNGTPGSNGTPTPGGPQQGGPSQGSNPGGVNTPGSLAYTGVRVGGLLLGAVVLIVAGVLVARRRREEREQR